MLSLPSQRPLRRSLLLGPLARSEKPSPKGPHPTPLTPSPQGGLASAPRRKGCFRRSAQRSCLLLSLEALFLFRQLFCFLGHLFPPCHLLPALTLTTTSLQMVPNRSVLDILHDACPLLPHLLQVNFCSVLFQVLTLKLGVGFTPQASFLSPICCQFCSKSRGKHLPAFPLPLPFPNKPSSFQTWPRTSHGVKSTACSWLYTWSP